MPDYLHGRQLLSPEAYQLLQFLPTAAVTIDIRNEKIINCNCGFTKLTGFSSTEIINQPVANLFDDPHKYTQIKKNSMTTDLVHKDLNRYPATIRFSYLDLNKQLGLLLVENPVDLIPEDTRCTGFTFLAEEFARSGKPAEEWICENKELFTAYLNVDVFGYYSNYKNRTALKKKCQFPEQDQIPEQLPLTDFERLMLPRIWTPGKRVLTEIHRFGRMKNYAFLVTIGVKIDERLKGMFIFGYKRQLSANINNQSMMLFKLFIEEKLLQELVINDSEASHRKKDSDLETYAQVFRYSQEGICIVDSKYEVTQINPAAEWMLGYADWEVKGQHFDNLLIGPKNLSDAIEQAREGVATHNLGETVLHHRDGHSFPVQIQVIPLNEKMIPSNMMIVFRDISEHEQIIARTQQLEHRALLGDVTSVFAHEVRNPINNISTGLQLVASRMPEKDPNHEVILRVQTDCVRLNDLMESVLAFSRPVEQKFDAVDIPSLLRKLIDRWHPRMSKSGIQSNIEIESDMPAIQGNTRSLERVFINLISNAVDAMEKSGGVLAIKVGREVDAGKHQVLKISIADSGVGMPEEIRKRLFEPFVTNKQHGTGLGLAITKKIITAHKGTIQVESFAGGTIFHVMIPINNGVIQ